MAGCMSPALRRQPGRARAARVRLKPQDSFDLIRLIARSQADARKAVGELVQNSLDAGAQHVEITWFNDKGARCLRILDQGEGIFPELPREDALREIAQTIGHSHKCSLSPAERHQQMVLGKYGIGLLGFWCLAKVMEIRSRVRGSDVWVLRLIEDRSEAEVFRARSQKSLLEETFTEIILREVKESVQRQVRPSRLQAYLAGELRGQLLQRGTDVRIHDRVARGRATKEFLVKPRAFLGIPLETMTVLEVPGHEDARLELYSVPPDEGRHGVVSLACGGATVLDDVAMVDPTDPREAARAPWCSGRLEGVIDFPDLVVAPGTRRGFLPDEAALDFLIALEKLEQRLRQHLTDEDRRRARVRREQVAREIRRAFRPVAKRLPQYDLMDVRSAEPGGQGTAGLSGPALDGPAAESGEALPSAPSGEPGSTGEMAGEAPDQPPVEQALFAPGPLAILRLRPARLHLAPSVVRRVVARPEDADGRPVRDDVQVAWHLEGPGTLEGAGAAVVYRAPDEEGKARIEAVATQGERTACAEAEVRIDATPLAAARTAGIPEPQPVNAPSAPWRSRMRGDVWQYNEGHRDYVAVAGEEGRRLRYLIHLFAKEVVLKNFGSPPEEELLERMVEVLTYVGNGRGR
jgi:hypothetical protein